MVCVQFYEKDGLLNGSIPTKPTREEGQSHLACRWQPRPSGEAAPDPASARLDVHDPRRSRAGYDADRLASLYLKSLKPF